METVETPIVNVGGRAALYSKIAKVMGALERIEKGGHNSFHGYDYATAPDVADAVRRQLSEHGIAHFASIRHFEKEDTGRKTKGGITIWRYFVTFDYTFACSETGESVTWQWVAQAEDESDKGINKAATVGQKHFLLRTFVLSTGDDIDPDGEGVKGKPAHWSETNNLVNWLEKVNTKMFRLEESDKVLPAVQELLGIQNLKGFKDGKLAYNAVYKAYTAKHPQENGIQPDENGEPVLPEGQEAEPAPAQPESSNGNGETVTPPKWWKQVTNDKELVALAGSQELLAALVRDAIKEGKMKPDDSVQMAKDFARELAAADIPF
jgi:hypothetical protein